MDFRIDPSFSCSDPFAGPVTAAGGLHFFPFLFSIQERALGLSWSERSLFALSPVFLYGWTIFVR